MSSTVTPESSEMAILRRVVDSETGTMSAEAAREILRLSFSPSDRARMDELAAKNRAGKLSAPEEAELDGFIRVGQTLGILQSKARRSLKPTKKGRSGKP